MVRLFQIAIALLIGSAVLHTAADTLNQVNSGLQNALSIDADADADAG